jgi:ubiquinone/menaquinone biosynthesis C-methylase UbiE
LDGLEQRASARGLGERFRRVEQDAESLELRERVDLVVCVQTLHHLQNPRQALESAWSNLRSGGRLWVMELESHSLDLGHRWPGFGAEDLHRLLVGAGFFDSRVEPVGRDRRQLSILLATGVRP